MRSIVLVSILVVAAHATGQRGTVTSYAPGCGGAVLNGAFMPIAGGGGSELLDLQASGLHPHSTARPAFGVMAWGWNPIQVPVVGFPGCVLHLEPVWSIGFVPDAVGNHVWQRSWPRDIGGFFRIQMGTLQADPLDVRVTNAILANSNN